MPRKKKIIKPIIESIQDNPADSSTEVVAEESEAKKQFRILMETYENRNPEKYAQKEGELLKKLNSL
ncbi:MAG: hypothetical protein PHT54_03560 [Candidatus Nanoarchaeia archaeon]|nr:hypothetical protein [Candidatus Nanoarchaeia archaeon]